MNDPKQPGKWVPLLEYDKGIRGDDYITIIDMEAHVWVPDQEDEDEDHE